MGAATTIVLRAATATSESFAPFGCVPSDEGSPGDDADVEFLWDDGHVNYIGHHRDEVPAGPTGLCCELLNRHDTHTQTLMPVDVDAIVVVAPAGVDFSRPEDRDTVRAFRIPVGVAVHLWRGTWHWGPYPVAAETVRLFNVQGTGYRRDNGIVHLRRDHGLVFEVDAGA